MADNTLSCMRCGSENVATEKRPNGFHICQQCGYRWTHVAQIIRQDCKPSAEKTITAEIQKMKLEPGDDLIVKLRGFDMDEIASLQSLKNMLEEKYPANRVLVFYLPEGTEIDFSIIKKI